MPETETERETQPEPEPKLETEPWLIFMYHKCQLSMSIYIMLLPHCGYVSDEHMYLKTENRQHCYTLAEGICVQLGTR